MVMLTEDYIRKEIVVNDNRGKFFFERYIKRIKEMQSIEIPPNVVTHKHHIVPRWLGGVDDEYNLVTIPIKHHLYLHKLLYQCLRTRQSLCAVMIFSGHWNVQGAFYQTKVKPVNQFYDEYIELQRSLTKNSIWLTDGRTDTRAKGEKAVSLLMEGWKRGRCSKSVNGMVMVFDNKESKNVKISKEMYEADKERYRKLKHTTLVDMSAQDELPYVSFYTGDSSEIDNVTIFSLSGIAKKLKDGRWKLISEVTEEDDINFKSGRDMMGARFNGAYVTPFGIFKSVWDFEEQTPYGRGVAISLCKTRCDVPFTKNWHGKLKKERPFPLTEKDYGKTPRELGWCFKPKEDLDLEALKNLYPDLDLTRFLS